MLEYVTGEILSSVATEMNFYLKIDVYTKID